MPDIAVMGNVLKIRSIGLPIDGLRIDGYIQPISTVVTPGIPNDSDLANGEAFLYFDAVGSNLNIRARLMNGKLVSGNVKLK